MKPLTSLTNKQPVESPEPVLKSLSKNTFRIKAYLIGFLLLISNSVSAQKIDFDQNFNSNLIKSCDSSIKQEGKIVRTFQDKIYYTSNCVNTRYNRAKSRLIRIDENGNLDSSFITNELDSLIFDIDFQSNGKIILTSSEDSSLSSTHMIRLNTNGSIDSTFKTVYTNMLIKVVRVLSDDKILIGGSFTKVNGQNYRGIIRLTPNGEIDSTFIIGSGINLSLNHLNNSIETIQFDSRYIYIGGKFDSLNNIKVSKIAKLNYNGHIDTNFKLDTRFTSYIVAASHLLDNGKLLLAGHQSLFVKINSDGIFDSSFKNLYFGASYNTGLQTDPVINVIKTQENGKILIGGWLGTRLPNEGRSCIVRLNNDGSLDSFSGIKEGVQSTGSVLDISLDKSGNILAAGKFNTFNGNSNFGVMRLLNRDCPLIDTTLFVNICDGYNFNNKYLTQSGTYFDTLQSNNGCDSLIRLDLVINDIPIGIDSIIACDSFRWKNGITYFESTDSVYFNTKNNLGCDSIVRLKLIVNKTTFFVDTITTCDSFQWINNKKYYNSNFNDTFILKNQNGCDSIVKLHLILNKTSIAIDSIEACDSFTWINNKTYTSSNTTDSIIYKGGALSGCDSIVIINLRINKSRPIGVMTGDSINIIATQPYIYAVTQQSSVSYNWTIQNGIILNGLNNNVVTVQWLSSDSGQITASITDTNNCSSSITKSLQGSLSAKYLPSTKIKVYPNPSQDFFMINLENNLQIQDLKIYNLIGQQISFELIEIEKDYKIILEEKEPGVYFVEVKLTNQERIVFKIVMN